jgi:uncharacterized membrane protein
VAPTIADRFARHNSAWLSGPLGRHAVSGGSWWTPLRVLLAVTTATFLLGMLQKAPCVNEEWSGTSTPYTHLCYSDIGYLYAGRGFAEGITPYVDGEGRYPFLEYPVLTGGFAYGAALITHLLVEQPDVSTTPVEEIGTLPSVQHASAVYFAVTVVGLFGCALLAIWALAGVHRRRPWDATLVAASPALALAGTINWDLLAMALVCGALLAWSRSRPVLAGILIGLGTAAKLYPLLLLGPLLLVCLRARRLPAYGWALLGAVGAWLAVNLPVYLASPQGWSSFWTFNAGRSGEFGSFWYVLAQAGRPVSSTTINRVSLVAFALACLAVAALAFSAERRPRLPQLAFLVVAAFLLVNKVYSPQYVLWMLPLAVLARPRWVDQLIWQLAEVFYWVTIWMHIGNMLDPGGDGVPDRIYWLAVAVRIAATGYLMALVVRDIVQPWHDPVRADAVTDDPAGGVVDGTDDTGSWWQRPAPVVS